MDIKTDVEEKRIISKVITHLCGHVEIGISTGGVLVWKKLHPYIRVVMNRVLRVIKRLA